MNLDDYDEGEFPATADRLRRTLATVAASTPTPDRTAELLTRLPQIARPADSAAPTSFAGNGDDPGPETLYAPHPSPVRRGRRLAMVAAVALLVGAAAVAVSLAGEDDGPKVKAGPGDLDTGWILPPAGWQISSVRTDFIDIGETGACPCTTWVAARPGTTPAVVTVSESAVPEDQEAEPSEPVDVGGRRGRLSTAGISSLRVSIVSVDVGSRSLVVRGARVERSDLVALADAWLDQRATGGAIDVGELPLPDGFERATAKATPMGRAWHLVMVHARAVSTGETVVYEFIPADFLTHTLLSADDVEFDGSAFAMTGAGYPGGPGFHALIGGGNVDIAVGVNEDGTESSSSVTPADLRAFRDGLHEVSTAEWREALAAAGDVDQKVLDAPTLTEPPLFVP